MKLLSVYKRIKEKYKILVIIFLSFGVFLLLIYFAGVRVSSEAEGWYNASWDYRRPITITNSGSSQSNVDVLVSLDTASLIPGKLQSSCQDLRFTDSNGSTLINYWIEGGCNTSTTQIWVRVPSVPNGGKTIYVYYGNSSASAGEQSWTNNFIALSDQSSCATGWSRISAFDSRFPRGANSYGGTGGSATHTHSSLNASTNSTSATVSITSAYNWGKTMARNTSHNHSASVSLTTGVNNLPPYVNMLFCGKSKLDIPTNHIAFFDVGSQTGWTRYSALDNRLPRGASSSIGNTGGSTTHSHTVSFSVSSRSLTTRWAGPTCTSNCRYPVGSSHGHSASNTSTTGDNVPAYRNVVFMKKNSAGTLDDERPIYIIDSSTLPPYGWESFTGFSSRIPRGATSYGGTGGYGYHSHSGTRSTGGASTFAALWGGSEHNGLASHTHTITWSAGSTSNIPPYRNAVFVKRKSSLSTSIGSEETGNEAPTAPTSLLTNDEVNPTGIVSNPYFSAIFNDPDTGDTGEYYHIQVNTASNFGGTTMWDSGVEEMDETEIGERSPNITYDGNSLSFDGTTYYWRIRFGDNHGAIGAWSATAQFTTVNTAPTAPTELLTNDLTNPQNVLIESTPYFSAIFNDPNPLDTAGHYRIQVNTNSSFTGTTMWDSNKTSMTTVNQGNRSPNINYNGTDLNDPGVTYYWRIKFWDASDAESPWSSTASFTTLEPQFHFEDLEMEGLNID